MSSCCRTMFNSLTSAVTFYTPLLALGLTVGAKVIGNTCNNVKEVGFAALKSLQFEPVTQGIQNVCALALSYGKPVSESCKVLTEEGLGPAKKLLSKDIIDFLYDTCSHNAELERICSEVSSIGFAAFENIGPFDAKQQVLDVCSLLSDRKITLALAGLAGYFAVYFTIRKIYNNHKADSVCEKDNCKQINAKHLKTQALLDAALLGINRRKLLSDKLLNELNEAKKELQVLKKTS